MKGLYMNKNKVFTQLVDIETREIVGEGELTPAAVKRLINLYKVQGYYVEAVA